MQLLIRGPPGIAAFVNLFPRKLATESASRMLTYALLPGPSGQLAEAHAWLQRARVRIGDAPEPRAEDVATLDVLRLATFTVTAGAVADEIDAGRRAVEAVEAGLDLGVAGARAGPRTQPGPAADVAHRRSASGRLPPSGR
jgi:hypothetical protein